MSHVLPALKAREVLRALRRAGFEVHHVSGGHYVLKNSRTPTRRVTLPWHNRDLKRKTLASIVQQSGLTVEEFLELV